MTGVFILRFSRKTGFISIIIHSNHFLFLIERMSSLKKHLIILLCLALSFTFTKVTFGAVHHYQKNLPHLDSWYTLNENPASLAVFADSEISLGGEYYQNEQTYLGVKLTRFDELATTGEIQGSILLFDKFFAGFKGDYTHFDLDKNTTSYTIWPGYRYNYQHGYATISLNCGERQEVDLDGLYLNQKTRLSGEFLISTADYSLDLQGRYQLFDTLTTGLDLFFSNANYILLGGTTWKITPNMIFDGQFGQAQKTTVYNLSGIYYFNQLGLGVEYGSARLSRYYYLDEAQLILKGKYSLGDGNLIAKVGLPSKTMGTTFLLCYEKSLK